MRQSGPPGVWTCMKHSRLCCRDGQRKMWEVVIFWYPPVWHWNVAVREMTVGVASLADAGLVTVGVTDPSRCWDGVPADLAGVVTIGVSPLAETGMVTVGVTDGADAAPVKGEAVDICCSDRLSPKPGVKGGLQSGMICTISLLAQSVVIRQT